MRKSTYRTSLCAAIVTVIAVATASTILGQCPASVPVEGANPPGPLPLFPADNWWNTDISGAPVDPNSAAFINFAGATRSLHPDFGGETSPGATTIYGMPWAIVDGSQPKVPVEFDYPDESDGVDHSTQTSVPFYPIPTQAITQAHWIEEGYPGNVDRRSQSDRHLLLIDCVNRDLYELYHVYYDTNQGKWFGGSGAFFDLDSNARRPDGWTSADAAGLAIYPGLVRWDEVYGTPDSYDIGHAFRMTVHGTNGYVYPASHHTSPVSGAPPMGARYRLKAQVNGQDPALRTSDPAMRKIFRAMQKYGLIVADNGSDFYITGTFDTRWNNDVLNPAFALLKGSDFEVVQLGWQPPSGPAALGSVTVSPSSVVGPNGSTGTATLTSGAPSGGATVTLSSSNTAVATVPASVTVAQGAASATFAVTTAAVTSAATSSICGTYGGVTKCSTLTVNPPPPPALSTLSLSPTSVRGGTASTGTVTLTAPAPAGGAVVALASNRPATASVPSSVTVPQGGTSATFPVTTTSVRKNTSVTIQASYGGVAKTASLTVTKR